MYTGAGRPEPPNAAGDVKLAKLFGSPFNVTVLVAFALGLFCGAMPGLHAIREPSIIDVLVAPLYFLLDIHLNTLMGLLSAFQPIGNSPIPYITTIFLPCMLLWLAIVWVWILHAIDKSSVWRRQRLDWWLAPIMLWVLSILWATHIPLSINFALHKSAFEKLADRVVAEPSGKIDFTPNQPMGLFSISGAFRLSPTIASIETTSEQGLWAHEGFVRDLSRKLGGLKANTYSLAPGSNNGEQDIVYLGDGWYVFQNLFD
ncbi:MAG TPA: hypothetical protein V6D50_03175 [Chroococcales cyanobacterium]|jgi:hypothetical protein